MSLIDFIKNNPTLKDAPEIIFFGGSFNPWHDGHSACVKLAPKNTPLIVLPDHNPQKDLNTSGEIDLLKLGDHLKTFDGHIFLFNEFYQSQRPNPSISWIRELKKQVPSIKLSLLLGNDSFINLYTWKDSKELLVNLFALYVVGRLDDKKLNNQREVEYKKINSALKISFQGGHPFENISSSMIRGEIR